MSDLAVLSGKPANGKGIDQLNASDRHVAEASAGLVRTCTAGQLGEERQEHARRPPM